jgi:hypothetical protein
MATGCEAPTGPLAAIPGGLSLEEIQLDHQGGVLERGHPFKLTTRKEQWTYSARIPFHMPPAGNTALFALVHARVLQGRVGIGVLDRMTSEFQSETLVDPGPAVKEIFIPVVLPGRAVHLIFRTAAPSGMATSVLIEDVSLVTPAPRDAPHLVAR